MYPILFPFGYKCTKQNKHSNIHTCVKDVQVQYCASTVQNSMTRDIFLYEVKRSIARQNSSCKKIEKITDGLRVHGCKLVRKTIFVINIHTQIHYDLQDRSSIL